MRIIPVKLTNKKASTPAMVDDDDYEYLKDSAWSSTQNPRSKTRYCLGSVHGQIVYMHRHILKAKSGEVVDHINGNGLDNRRSNLRLCTRSQNQARVGLQSNNTSGFVGVIKSKNGKRWCAVAGKKHIGTFDTKIEAALAYNKAAKERFGVFAHQNKIS